MTDTVADMLTRIRNAGRAQQPELEFAYSRLNAEIARVLKEEGYIAECAVEGAPRRRLKLKLKFQGRTCVIVGIRRISRPGLRHYVGHREIPRVLGGLGTAILSTPRGVMTGTAARRAQVGGELLCYIW